MTNIQTLTIKSLNVNSIDLKKESELKNAKIVFDHALQSVNRFYKLFQNRDGNKGGTTHNDQDLLRAMLVFSCSGLDAVLKQIIKDTLPKVIDCDNGAHQEFQKFIERRIKKINSMDDKEKIYLNTNLLASVIASREPRTYLVKALQEDLDKDSLQSKDQLLKIASHFAITQKEVLEDSELTKKAFDVRNEIVHQMDTDFRGRKKRQQRTCKDMVIYCQNIFSVASNFINLVQKKINGIT